MTREPNPAGTEPGSPAALKKRVIEIVRWLLVLPAGWGMAAAGLVVAFDVDAAIPSNWLLKALPAILVLASGIGVAVYLAARVAPRGRTTVAIGLSVVVSVAAVAWVVLNRADSGSLGNHLAGAAAVAAASAISAWIVAGGPTGLRRRWLWLLAAPLLAALVYEPFERSRESRVAPNPSATAHEFRSDGLAFRYPSSWTLKTGNWDKRPSGQQRRTLDLDQLHGEGVVIFQFRPSINFPFDDETLRSEFNEKGLVAGSRPLGPPASVVAVIGGKPVQGVQRDVAIRAYGIEISERIRWFQLRRKDQTIVLMTTTALEDMKEAEPRVRYFLESLEAD